jgi:hypothetical protein
MTNELLIKIGHAAIQESKAKAAVEECDRRRPIAFRSRPHLATDLEETHNMWCLDA